MAGNEMAKRPQASKHARRPVSVHAKVAAIVGGGTNPRYKGENVLALDLEISERTTQDYESLQLNPNIEQAIKEALEDDSGELHVDGAENLPTVGGGAYYSYDPEGSSKGKGGRKKKSQQTRRQDDLDTDALLGASNSRAGRDEYPQARGLVPSR